MVVKLLTYREVEPGAGAGRKVHGEMTDGAKLCREEEKERTAVSSGSGHRRVTVIVETATLVSQQKGRSQIALD